MLFELAGVGLVVGLFVGMSGVGGGSIMTPVLILVAGLNPLAAVGTDLAYSVPTKIFGAYLHAKQETLDWTLVQWLCIGGLPGAALGIGTLFALRSSGEAGALDAILRRAIAAALVLAAIALVAGNFTRMRRNASEPPRRTYTQGTVAAAGAVTGFIVAVTSIGSGAVLLPLLLLLAPAAGIRRLIGTDIAFAAILIPLAATGHAALGDVNLPVAGALLAGSLPGVFAGSKLCRYAPARWLRPAVAAVLVVAAARLL